MRSNSSKNLRMNYCLGLMVLGIILSILTMTRGPWGKTEDLIRIWRMQGIWLTPAQAFQPQIYYLILQPPLTIKHTLSPSSSFFCCFEAIPRSVHGLVLPLYSEASTDGAQRAICSARDWLELAACMASTLKYINFITIKLYSTIWIYFKLSLYFLKMTLIPS